MRALFCHSIAGFITPHSRIPLPTGYTGPGNLPLLRARSISGAREGDRGRTGTPHPRSRHTMPEWRGVEGVSTARAAAR